LGDTAGGGGAAPHPEVEAARQSATEKHVERRMVGRSRYQPMSERTRGSRRPASVTLRSGKRRRSRGARKDATIDGSRSGEESQGRQGGRDEA
jgi:hypothetical protein